MWSCVASAASAEFDRKSMRPAAAAAVEISILLDLCIFCEMVVFNMEFSWRRWLHKLIACCRHWKFAKWLIAMFCTPSFNHHACIDSGIDLVSELIKFANGDRKISCLQIESGLAGLTLHPVESIAFLLFLSSPAAGKDVNSGPPVGRILLINARNYLHKSPLHSCLRTTILV